MNWREDAACRDMGSERFYHTRNVGVTAAKRICQPCPVRADCLAEALARPEYYGVWGGTSANERRKIRRGEAQRTLNGQRRNPRRLEPDFDSIVEQYTRAGHTGVAIAERLGVHKRTVERARARNRNRSVAA
ncbi:MAG TPA: WhiB family transcriptional regulator [Actinophytocola sp.]|uniref:WhiB family transcriptional regulator n=1 Tax=Actinophytocola sp. TaxID=1872138 RepID=UPI002DBBC176|nr:WhiB family transcriptional regulator [Actinophytocola sp.]HEU5475673.1 WhiB family transcriptional regulator [Actinophytocola sp.]